jgi:predicted nucleic acid-binding protein
MPGFMPDTSCIVAVILRGHAHHQTSTAEIDLRLNRGESLHLAAHSLIEAYSVLTRLPPAVRLNGIEARSALDDNFVSQAQVWALSAEEYVQLLDRAVREGILGGPIYDAVIAACAVKAQADVFLTFNERHFSRVASPTLQVVVPSA